MQSQTIEVRAGDGTTDVVVPGWDDRRFDLQWDPTLLNYESITPGGFGTVTINESQVGSGQVGSG